MGIFTPLFRFSHTAVKIDSIKTVSLNNKEMTMDAKHVQELKELRKKGLAKYHMTSLAKNKKFLSF